MADPAALDALRRNPPGLPRYAVVSDRGGAEYVDSRLEADTLAERRPGGVVIERETGAFYQRGIFALGIGRCRACAEHVCTLRSHQVGKISQLDE